METGEKTPRAKMWSVLTGPDYDAALHKPSAEAMKYVLNPENFTKPDIRLRIAAGGTLINILELLHPDLQVENKEIAEQLKELRQEAGKSVMYSSRLGVGQKKEIFERYNQLQLPEPTAAQVLRELRNDGLDSEVAELAEWGLMVMALKEANPDIKLPTPPTDNMR